MKKTNVVNLGRRRWRGIWVSKNDVVEFIRCQYRVYLSHVTGVPIGEMKDAQRIGAILEKGMQYESSVISEGKFKELSTGEAVEPLVKQNLVLRAPQLFRNHDLGIQGIPDLINMGKGKLYPIEIKIHKEIADSDRLELAFYWKLLEPLRQARTRPKGYVILGTGETVEVRITLDALETVEFLIDEVRQTKKDGIEPTLSRECKLCTLVVECRRQVSEKGGLSLVYNIKGVRQEQLKRLGVSSISDLAKADALDLHENWLREFRTSPGYDEIRRMQAHAFSLIARKPVFFGDRDALGQMERPKIVIDLEYEPGSLIWLVGIHIKSETTNKFHQFFAGSFSPDGERRILMPLRKVLRDYPNHLVLTYGASADMPQLEKAWARQRFPPGEWQQLQERHIEVNTFVRRSFRLPLATLELKDVEEYLGFERKGERIDGLIALGLYMQYLRERREEKKLALKKQLLKYNREDLEATAFVVSQLKHLLGNCLDAGCI